MGAGVWIAIILVLAVVAAALYAVNAYNGLVRQRNLIEESWRQVDVELKRRYDLIPNLVETVKGYASHEKDTLENVVRLRNQASQMSGPPSAERAATEDQLSGAIRQLMVNVEAYPQLQANTNFEALQRQLAETEDRIAAGRRYYNANVSNYNTRIEQFPTSIIAGMGKFVRATYFEVNDAEVRQAPQVSFSGDDKPASSDAATPAIGQAYQSPNYSVRSGVSDSAPPVPADSPAASQTPPPQAMPQQQAHPKPGDTQR